MNIRNIGKSIINNNDKQNKHNKGNKENKENKGDRSKKLILNRTLTLNHHNKNHHNTNADIINAYCTTRTK